MSYFADHRYREEELKNLLQSAVESAYDSIIITEFNLDPPGPRIEYVNPAFTRMTQYSEAEVMGRSPRFLQGPKTSRELMKQLRENLLSQQFFHGETVNYRKDGSEYFVEWRVTPVCDREGKAIKWLAMQRDVTARMKAEGDLRASESHLRAANFDLEQFVYAASHDLQEPIRNVNTHAEIIKRRFGQQISPELREHLDIMQRSAGSMGEMVRALLAYARASHSQDQPDSNLDGAAADPNETLQQILVDLAPLVAQTKGQVYSNPLPMVRMHSVHVRQILQNLLTNAFKYRRPDVDPIVKIQAEEQGRDVLISVGDNGIGIPAAYHDHIFGVFRRLHDNSVPGTGFGLAIAKRAVERYGQKIWLESRENQGSTFFFTAPALQ